MQYQMSSAPAPDPAAGFPATEPQPAHPRPAVVPGRHKRRGPRLLLFAALLAAAATAAAVYLKTGAGRHGQSGGSTITLRTAPVLFGDLQRTVRITGVVQAESFAAIMAPQLHGSHSSRGRGGSGMTGNASTSVSVPTASSMGTSGVSNTSSSSSSASASSGGSSGSDDTPGGSGGLGQQRSSARVSGFSSGGSSRSSSRGSGGGGSSRSSASAGGGEEVAPSSGSMRGSSGGRSSGGGGSSDFMLVLLNVAKPGSLVKKGEVIAEFDRQYQLLRLDDYRASVEQLEKNIRKLKAELEVSQEAQRQAVRVAKADLDKGLLDLKTAEVRSEIDKERLRLYEEEAQARYKKALDDVALYEVSERAQLRAAGIDLNQAQIELKRAEANVGRMIMKAPIDGIVVMQTIFRGGEFGQVQQGDQIYPGMFFMSIVDPRSMVLNANVNQVDSEMLRIGMKAQVKLDAYPDLQLPATVIGIGAMTKSGGWRAAYVREIPVRLKLDGMEPRVIPDLTASADVVLASERQAALAPREAVFYENGLERPFMFLRAANGWVRRDVELGLHNHIMVSVRSGLRKGDVVAVTRPPQS